MSASKGQRYADRKARKDRLNECMKCSRQRDTAASHCTPCREDALEKTMVRYWAKRALEGPRPCGVQDCDQPMASRLWCQFHLDELQRAARLLYPGAQDTLEVAKNRDGKLRKQYGITLQEYQEMWVTQGGRCRICGRAETVVRKGTVCNLSVDHCHDTGRVRGLLCNNCNRAIGLLGDDPATMADAVEYLMEVSN